MSTDTRRLVCFEDGKGFMVYHPNDGSVSHTMHRSEASESPAEDWCDIPEFDHETCTLMANFELP